MGDHTTRQRPPTRSTPGRRSRRKTKKPSLLLNQMPVDDQEPAEDCQKDRAVIIQKEEEEKGHEIFLEHLKPAGWRHIGCRGLKSTWVFVAKGIRVKDATEGVSKFYCYRAIWKKWKSDKGFRDMIQTAGEDKDVKPDTPQSSIMERAYAANRLRRRKLRLKQPKKEEVIDQPAQSQPNTPQSSNMMDRLGQPTPGVPVAARRPTEGNMGERDETPYDVIPPRKRKSRSKQECSPSSLSKQKSSVKRTRTTGCCSSKYNKRPTSDTPTQPRRVTSALPPTMSEEKEESIDFMERIANNALAGGQHAAQEPSRRAAVVGNQLSNSRCQTEETSRLSPEQRARWNKAESEIMVVDKEIVLVDKEIVSADKRIVAVDKQIVLERKRIELAKLRKESENN
mmetsp:Transcript_9381/g.22199  ORF Transcript_9381/g.22199 Transcript_9381/m.22199 type:complete len:396 (+) Transcript_9381:182-1369(+)|eukprot:CAMPEP_0113635480 /NCGR_PEP_ID=MMETSP0017_2-20120614/18498_1 /TAXON_ID=2856 /ORGANISM="Cylindrotheca closterium" /LENGTH=395 /DNA_ID=CAMNT_0000546269 /DNA_START=24 /DNA_END=1211 /DNA_ORIENTATION=- /assembly_acc=CAM_ASM_000147